MRIVIKNADFSNVSIGKVYKDLSFQYGLPLRTTAPNLFVNYDAENDTFTKINYYVVSNSQVSLTETTGSRLITDFIEVVEGMRITFGPQGWKGSSADTVKVVCFDENKQLITNKYYNVPEGTSLGTSIIDFTIPSGVKYVKLQSGPTMPTMEDDLTHTNLLKFEMPIL